jgi:Uma2 family endonuclease
MGVLAGVSVEEYLHSSFPGLDREYRDGALVERSMPDYLHGKTQALLIALFMALRKRLSLYPCAETRMMLRAGRFLIPDVAVFHLHEPELVPDTPPLIAIEILSPDDRLTEVREKLEEYRAWGVPHVWLVDPHSRRLYSCDAGLREVSSFTVGELGVEVTADQVFE